LPGYLRACEILAEAKLACYPLDHRVIELVVGHQLTLRKAAEIIYKTDAKSCREFVGKRLRAGLRDLADKWFPMSHANGPGNIRSLITERPTVTDAQEIVRGAVYHSYRVA
jgi:hypothetical protein